MKTVTSLILLAALSTTACSSDDGVKTDADYERSVVTGMHASLLGDIETLHDAALGMQKEAPAPASDGWSESRDAAAIQKLTDEWLRARGAYERIEGAIAPLFSEIDAKIDARYEDYLEVLGADGDPNPFDGEGATGMHSIERIVFAKEIPAAVVSVEETLPGYWPAAWPSTEQEAKDFREGLCAQLVTDTGTLLDQWKPQSIDLGGAFGGLVALMNEQREKVSKAASAEEESRYAQRTMADIRDNLAGTRKAYALFQPWLETKSDGKTVDDQIEGAFTTLDGAYDEVHGDAIPEPPATWSSETPTEADLATPFGKLFSTINDSVDPNEEGSAVDGMNKAAKALGFPEFVEE